MNNNNGTTYQNLWDPPKTTFREKFWTSEKYIRKEGNLTWMNCVQFKKLENKVDENQADQQNQNIVLEKISWQN